MQTRLWPASGDTNRARRLAEVRSIALAFAAPALAVGCGSSASSPRADSLADSGIPSTVTAGGLDASLGFLVCARLDEATDCLACCASSFPAAQTKVLAASAGCACSSAYCGADDPADAAPLGARDGDSLGSQEDGAASVGAPANSANVSDAAPDGPTAGSLQAARVWAAGFTSGAKPEYLCRPGMCSASSLPAVGCVVCALGLLQGASGTPLCPESVEACKADPDCAPILRCSDNCPGATPD